jgi:magnesium-transporting ATPase (P-type)
VYGIVTAMSNLAYAANAPALPFNSDFYTTIATVIPVLLLAFAVQSPNPWQVMLQIAATSTRIARSPEPHNRTIGRAALVAWLFVALAAIVVFAGFWSEYLALTALYNHTATHQQRVGMLVTAIALTFGVIIVPMWQARTVFGESSDTDDSCRANSTCPASSCSGSQTSGEPPSRGP